MERIPEPELMEGAAQAQAYGAADFSATDHDLVQRLVQLVGANGPSQGLRIMDLGCGPGNITFRLAERFRHAQVVGLDGADAMLDLARQALRRKADWQQRVTLALATLPLAPGSPLGADFGVVVSNSLLHHLHDPQVLWRAIGQLAAPGAVVLIRDLRRPATPEAILALVQRYASGAPELLQRDYGHSLAAAFTLTEVRAQLREAQLPWLEAQELGDRYLEVAGRLP